MTPNKKYIAIGAICFFVGVMVGASAFTWLLAGPTKFFSDIGQAHMMGQFAKSQYSQTGYPHNKKALEQYMKYLDNYRVVEGSTWFSEGVLVNEKLMTSVRIALLSEEHKKVTEAETAWARAEELASLSNWKAKNRNTLRAFVQKVDEVLK